MILLATHTLVVNSSGLEKFQMGGEKVTLRLN
jgi:hypothetical protein